MKKMILVLMMLILVLGAPCALAQVTLEEYALQMNAGQMEWIDGTNLLLVRDGSGYAALSLDGKTVIGAQEGYYSFTYADGCLIAQKYIDSVNDTGLLALDGSEIMPAKYGDVETISEYWAVGYVLKEATADHFDYETWSNPAEYYLIDTVDIYYLPEKKLAATLPRTNFADAQDAGRRINIEDRATGKATTYDKDMNAVGTDLYSVYDDDYAVFDVASFYERSRYGLRDWQGNVILAPTYDLIYSFYGDYAEVDLMDKMGLIDKQGKEILPAEFDEVLTYYDGDSIVHPDGSAYGAHGYFAVVVGDKFGYVDASGAFTMQPKYADSAVDHLGASATLEDLEGKTHILAADGVETVIETAYNSMYDLTFSGGMLYRVANEDYDYGLIDWHGETVLPCEYDSVALSGDGAYLLAEKGGKTVIYTVSYGTGAAGAAAPEDDEAAPKDDSANRAGARSAMKNLGKTKDKGEETSETVTETPAQEAPAQEAPAQENAAVVVLLDNAILLLNADAAANGAAAKGLITSASLLLAGQNDAAAAMLTSAATLLDVDAQANAASVVTLLQTAKAML